MKKIFGRVCIIIGILAVFISFYYIPNETLSNTDWVRVVFGSLFTAAIFMLIGATSLISYKEDMANKERRRRIREECRRQMREIYASEK